MTIDLDKVRAGLNPANRGADSLGYRLGNHEAVLWALFDALDAAHGTVEWEYGSKGYCFEDDYRYCFFRASSAQEIADHEEDAHGGNPSRIVRRRKAGEWEPVDKDVTE